MVRRIAPLIGVLLFGTPAFAQQRIFALTGEYPHTTSSLWKGHIEAES